MGHCLGDRSITILGAVKHLMGEPERKFFFFFFDIRCDLVFLRLLFFPPFFCLRELLSLDLIGSAKLLMRNEDGKVHCVITFAGWGVCISVGARHGMFVVDRCCGGGSTNTYVDSEVVLSMFS